MNENLNIKKVSSASASQINESPIAGRIKLTPNAAKTMNAPPAVNPGPPTCFLVDSVIAMADGTFKKIQLVEVGDAVLGAFGEHNVVLAKHPSVLGNTPMYKINNEHDTPGDHPHISHDRKFYVFEVEKTYSRFNASTVIIVSGGKTESWTYFGLNQGRLLPLTTSIFLQKLNGSKEVTSLESYNLPPETKLYHFAVGGSHTYIVNGYAVVGWGREDDFDYDTWTPTGINLTIDDYRVKSVELIRD